MPVIKPTIAEISEEFLIVGEGAGDAALMRHLCADRSIPGFQIEDAGGAGRFEAYMEGLKGRRGIQNLKALIVVADCDDCPDDSFAGIRRQLKAAKLPYPNTPFSIASRVDCFSVYVVMLPFNNGEAERGALETLLLPSAEAHLSSHANCLDQWCQCVGTARLSRAHSDKVRLRSLIAAAHPDDPNLGLQYAISPSKDLIPLGHSCFDELASLVRSIPGMFP